MAINNSINTNVGALVALRNLASVNSDLNVVRDRVSTGLKITSAKDDASIFAVAQGIRGDLKAYEAVGTALSAGKGLVSVAISGATSVSQTLQDVKSKLVQLSDDSLTKTQRDYYKTDLAALLKTVTDFITGAVYNGGNLLNGTLGSDPQVVKSTDGSSITIQRQDLWTSANVGGTFASAIDTVTTSTSTDGSAARAALSTGGALQTYTDVVNAALTSLGANNRTLDNQITFNTAISDATTEGLGGLVDADLAKESARLQALQTRQQLSIQTLSIANQAPGTLLSLFR